MVSYWMRKWWKIKQIVEEAGKYNVPTNGTWKWRSKIKLNLLKSPSVLSTFPHMIWDLSFVSDLFKLCSICHPQSLEIWGCGCLRRKTRSKEVSKTHATWNSSKVRHEIANASSYLRVHWKYYSSPLLTAFQGGPKYPPGHSQRFNLARLFVLQNVGNHSLVNQKAWCRNSMVSGQNFWKTLCQNDLCC